MCDNLVLEHLPYVKLLNCSKNKLNILCTSSLSAYLLHISRGQNMRDFGISFMSSKQSLIILVFCNLMTNNCQQHKFLKQKFHFTQGAKNGSVDSFTTINIPVKIDPLNLTVSLEPDLPSQQHRRVWKVHNQLARLHSGNTRHSHQQFQPK